MKLLLTKAASSEKAIEVVFGHLFRLSSAKSMDVKEEIFVPKDFSITATWACWDCTTLGTAEVPEFWIQ